MTDYGRDRRVESLFRRCATCDGRKEIRSPFGERRDCAACAKAGKVLDREALLEARWLRFTPLYRAEGGNSREINRLLRAAATKPEALAPYVKSVEIGDVEDHDFWMRVTAREQVQADAASQKTEKTEVVYILLRVGKVWYLHEFTNHGSRATISLRMIVFLPVRWYYYTHNEDSSHLRHSQ